VLHGLWTSGSFCGPITKHFAPTARQIVPSIRAYLGESLGDGFRARPFSISNWTPSGRRVSEYLYGALGGAHTGDALVTTPVLGNHPGEYRAVMQWAHDVESNIIWNADPRPYAVNAVNQAVELGIADGKIFAHLEFSEWQASQLVPGASIVTCVPFVASDPSPAVQDFAARARAMQDGELVTHVAFTHYNALMALKAAMERSGEADAAGGLAGLAGLTIETATGTLTLDDAGYPTMPLFVAIAEGGGPLQVVQKIDQVESGTTC
jgi:ABC-type branched-subunit amino acid transport system substrate-binding protein